MQVILMRAALLAATSAPAEPYTCTQKIQNGCMPTAAAIATFKGVAADVCCSKCASNPQCKAWTLNMGNSMCFLHPAASLLIPGDCQSAGGTPPLPPPPPPSPAPPGVKNVLVIIVDDLRPV